MIASCCHLDRLFNFVQQLGMEMGGGELKTGSYPGDWNCVGCTGGYCIGFVVGCYLERLFRFVQHLDDGVGDGVAVQMGLKGGERLGGRTYEIRMKTPRVVL